MLAMDKQKTIENAAKVVKYLIMLILAIITIFPFVVIIWVSLKSESDLQVSPWGFPKSVAFSNYYLAAKEGQFVTGYINSIIVTVTATLGQIIFGVMASYSLVKMKVKGKKFFEIFFIAPMVFPIQVVMIPLFMIFRYMHLVNSLIGVIIVSVSLGIALDIFIFSSFLSSIPLEISESAFVEGAAHIRVLFQIIMPMMKPVVTTAVITSGVGVWNDFFGPLLLLSKKNLFTLPLRLFTFQSEFFSRWTLVCTGIVYLVIPIIIVYMFLQKYIVAGAISGAVKG